MRWAYDKHHVCVHGNTHTLNMSQQKAMRLGLKSRSSISHGLMFPHLSLCIGRLPPKRGSILLWAFHHRCVMTNTARIECQDLLLEPILVPYVYAYVAEEHILITTFIDPICQRWSYLLSGMYGLYFYECLLEV